MVSLPRSPLPAAAAFLAAGLLAPAALRPQALTAALGAVALLALGLRACLAGPIDESSPRPLPPAAGCIVAAFLPLGLFLGSAPDLGRSGDQIARLLGREPGPAARIVTLEGSLREDPRPRAAPEGGCSIELDLVRVEEGRLSRPAAGAVRVILPDPPEEIPDPCGLGAGTSIRIPANTYLPRSFANPGALDYPRFLEARGIDALARAPSARLVAITLPPALPERLRGGARRGILAAIDRAFAGLPSTAAGPISKALLLGERDGVPREAEIVLQRSGTSHLLAVSGFNVAVLAACVLFLLRITGASLAFRSFLMAIVLLGYLLLTGREPSVERAVSGALLYLCALRLGRKPGPLGATAGVGLLLASASPAAVHDASFQLTFLATAALAVRAGPVAKRLPGPRWLAAAVAVDVVALSFTASLSARLFNRVTPGALVANLIASPLMAFAFIAAASIPGASLFSTSLGAAGIALTPELAPDSLLARAAAAAIEAALSSCRAVAALPGMSYVCITPPSWIVAAAVAASFLASGDGLPRAVKRCAAAAAVALTVLAVLPGERLRLPGADAGDGPAPPGALRLTVFDVGQGSSALLETPLGERLLVDAGGFAGSSFDVGERVLARSLLTVGIRRLDAVAASHEDFDHVGGMPAILGLFPGRELWISAADHARHRLERIESLAAARGRALRLNERGRRFRFGGALIEVLHPSRGERSEKDNELCQVLRVTALGRSILLAGDIEAETEREIQPLLAPADILLVPHHGSRTSSTAAFLAAARPSIGIISCGFANRFKHPHPEVLARLGAAGARVVRTDRDGAIRVTFLPAADGVAGMGVERFAAGGWTPISGVPASGDGADRAGDE